MIKIIDPHLHFFDTTQGDYAWLKPENPPFWSDKSVINHNFSYSDIALTAPFKHEGIVHIEAGFNNQQPWQETQWLELLENTAEDIAPPPLRTIANVDLTLEDNLFDELLTKLLTYQSIVGFRHILDDQAAQLLACEQVQRNLHKIAQSLKIFECQLDGCDTHAISLLSTYLTKQALDSKASQIPALQIVINHAAFADPDSTSFATWQENMQILASFENISVKASGWEMVNRQYEQRHLHTIIEQLIRLFGSQKVMLASNFPLCLFSTPYQKLWQSYQDLPINAEYKHQLMYANAKRIYQF